MALHFPIWIDGEEMPNIAEYDWLMDISDGSQNVLHAPTLRIIAHYADYYDHGEHYWESEESAEALCGHRGSWSIPGVFSRLGAPRCHECCVLSGYSDGDGSPKNDPEIRVRLGLGEEKC